MGPVVPAGATMMSTKVGGVVTKVIGNKIGTVVIPMTTTDVGYDNVVCSPILHRSNGPEWNRRVVQRLKGSLGCSKVARDKVGVGSFRTKHRAGVGGVAFA